MRPRLLVAAAALVVAAALSLCIALVPDARHASHATDAADATDAATDTAHATHATDHETDTAHATDATEETSEGRLAAPRPRSNPTSAALPTAAPTAAPAAPTAAPAAPTAAPAAPMAVPTPRGQVNFCNPRLLKPIGDVQHVGVKYEPIRPILLWGEGATETPLASSEAQEDQMVGARD